MIGRSNSLQRQNSTRGRSCLTNFRCSSFATFYSLGAWELYIPDVYFLSLCTLPFQASFRYYRKRKYFATMTPLRFSHIRNANRRNPSLLLASGRRAHALAFSVMGCEEDLQIVHDYAKPEQKDYCSLCNMSRPDPGNWLVVESLHSAEKADDSNGADCRNLPGHEYSDCIRSMSNIFTLFFASWVDNPEEVTFTSQGNLRFMGEGELRRVFLASFLAWLSDETTHWPVAERKCFCGAPPGDAVFG